MPSSATLDGGILALGGRGDEHGAAAARVVETDSNNCKITTGGSPGRVYKLISTKPSYARSGGT